MRRRWLIAGAVLLVAAIVSAFLLLPKREIRLELIAPPSAVVDRDGDVGLDLVVRETGSADMELITLSKAELTWEGGRAPLELLSEKPSIKSGSAASLRMRTTKPVEFPGSSEQATLTLEFVWLEGSSSGDGGSWERTSWSVPVQLRR